MMVVSVIGMSWPGAVLTCLIALSLYYGGCQAAVGDVCPNGDECTAPGEICSGTCICDTTTHYTNGTVCETKIAAGLNCPDFPADACFPNSVCSNNICTCNPGFYDSDGIGSTGTCVQKIAAGLNCAGLPVDACSTNSACDGNICICNSGFYDSDGSGSTGTCVPKVGPGLTCAGLPPDACSTNSVCSNNICTCNSGFYDSDGGGSTGTCVQKIAAGLNCAGLPADACTPNSSCTNTICTCNSGFYDNDGGGSAGTCEPQIALSGTCDNGLGVTQCWTSGAVCATDNKCRCASGTFDDNGFGTADGVCRDMNLLLVIGVQASNLGTNSVTISWTAPATYSSQVNRYEVTWTSPTQGGGSQSAGTATSLTVAGLMFNTQYSFTVQTVESGSQTSEQLVSSSPALTITTLSQLGETCGTCADSNAICSTTCICNTGYYDNNGITLGGTCVSTIALSDSCNSGLVGVTQCSDANAECTNAGGDVCRCMTGYFDSNGFSTTDGTCTAMSTLKVTGVSVTTQGTDTAIVTWTPPADASQVNNYQVIWSPAKGDGTSSHNVGIASTATISGFTSGSTYTFNVKTVESGSRTTAQEVESDSPFIAAMKAALSVACGTGSPKVVCEDTTTASCTLNVCRCNAGFFDSNGNGTSGGVCTAMSNLKVTSVTSSLITATTVTISWTPPADSSQISGYVVVATISNSGSVEGTYSAANTVTSRAITGLTSGTTYVFTVKSQETGSRTTTQEIESDVSVTVTTKVELTETCGVGLECDDANSECTAGNSGGTVCRCQSGYYDSNGYSTAGGVCTSISGLVVTSFMVGVEGTSTVTLEWSAPSSGSDQVNRYEVHWTPALANGTTVYNAGKTTSVKLTGFVSGQSYSFYVKSIESGSRAAEQEVQTTAKNITINAGLGVVCTGGIQCADSNAECISADVGTDNVCRCKLSYFDSNSYSTSGGMCVTMSELAVTGLTLTKEGTDTVNISWTRPSEYNNQVNRYEVHWTPSTTINGKIFYDAQLNTAVQLVGFVPGQEYTFSVRSVESGSRSQEQNYDTSASPITMKPSTATGFTATDIEGPEIILSWSLPSGIRTSYDVTTTPALTPTTTSTESITYSSNVLNGHQYNISIITVSGSEQSDPLLATFRTISTTPNPPTGVTCTTITDKSITLTWTAPVVPNGDIQHYIVNSITTNALFSTLTSITTYTVEGLQPETPYTFSVATVNDAVTPYSNQSGYSLQTGCPTKAAMSLEPNTSVVSQLQSRQFTLNWTKPLITNGDLWGYRLTVSDGTTCVWEVLFTCTTCTSYMAFVHECSVGSKQTVIIEPADLDSYTYIVDTLLPYTNYTVSVLAVNAAGNGHPNTQYVMTDQEVPQSPTLLTATVLSSTEINMTWAMSDPKPGPTTYTLYIIAESPETSRTETFIGFEVRSYKVIGLEEYRNYTFNLTAATEKGSAAFQGTLPSAKTLAGAPGVVSNFVVARPDGLNYTTVKVSWELPAVLDRNSDITHFLFSHNTTGGNLNSAPEEIPITVVTRDLAVIPQNTYYIEIYAIGTDTEGTVYTGTKSTNTYYAPPGAPPLDVGDTVIPSSSNTNIQATQTSFTLTLTDNFFLNTLYGTIDDYSLVLCKSSCTNLDDASVAVAQDYLSNLDGWKDARTNGFASEYRAMSKADFSTYLSQATSTSGRRKRSVNTFEVNIGTATNCETSTETYCNGPLDAGSIYFVRAVVCTTGGCTVSTLYGPYSTEKVPTPGPDTGVIIGVVCGIVAFAVVIVIVVLIVKRRRSSKPNTYKADEEVPDLNTIEKKNIPSKRPVIMERFPQHVADLHKDSKLKFAKEYEDLKELSPKHPCTAANEDGNKLKNRYVNILPFDHSRVKLNTTDPDDPTTDFINANYIPGYNSQREYIASQGPIPSTIDDFWRMIWEQQVAICVMLTLCKEDGRIKCEQYWPTERNEPKQYGDIVVEITSSSTVNTYDFRIFKLTQGDQTRTLKHFHFLNWKDFSANVQNDVMIDFIQNVRAHIQPPDKRGPMLIHCSAGVGRTGTYISLDQLIQFIDEHDFNGEIDIFDLVLSMRNYRVFMVQTEQQYVFIHDCAKDLIERKKARLQENDEDENLYVNKAYEEDPDENMYQNQNFYQNTTAKTEL